MNKWVLTNHIMFPTSSNSQISDIEDVKRIIKRLESGEFEEFNHLDGNYVSNNFIIASQLFAYYSSRIKDDYLFTPVLAFLN